MSNGKYFKLRCKVHHSIKTSMHFKNCIDCRTYHSETRKKAQKITRRLRIAKRHNENSIDYPR